MLPNPAFQPTHPLSSHAAELGRQISLPTMQAILLVGLGGFLGSIARYKLAGPQARLHVPAMSMLGP